MILKLKKKNKQLSQKIISHFRPQIRSRHPSHDYLRQSLGHFKFKSIVRLGSTTDLQDTISNGGNRIEVNTIQSIKNSSNKLLMKQCFNNSKVKTAKWWTKHNNGFRMYNIDGPQENASSSELDYPIVAKHIKGSRGTGNHLLNTQQELESWILNKDLNNYIFEKFYTFSREYRLHITKNGCFYTCRKVLKEDTPQDKRWFRNDSNSSWLLEDNDGFDKPVNWDEIVSECVKALDAVGLDIGGFDVKVQSANTSKDKKRKTCDFIIIESNSACSFGEITKVKYTEAIKNILSIKYGKNI